ncbi:Trypsin [Oryctes borbonicus]|uniref:CLIP domain-containing serine protease n=1 Tax=Oryctes borbonicus TaxID=1629725 RepID=A0A0T6AZ73_9SCAR|nr:Trypsin [Oryctes borbonicus]
MWFAVVILFVMNIYTAIGQRSCTTPNGELALCVSLQSCNIFYDYILAPNRNAEIDSYLVASKCGVDSKGYPLVCCGSDTKFQPTLPDRTKCGYQEDFKVLGGEDTDLSEFPWLTLLQQTTTFGVKKWACGGSLISTRYVLTAAHCSGTNKLTLARLGEWNLDTTEDCIGSGPYKACSEPPQDIAVEQVIPHPEYVRNRQGVFNDISLVRLARAAVFNQFVQPICLPLPQERSPIGTRVFVAGWGAVSVRQSYSSVKQKLKVPIVELQICANVFGKVNDKMVCAGGEKGKDSCKGDSGGPLIATISGGNQQFYIEGIVSYGLTACGTEGSPAIYTRVTDFLDWIRQTVKP